MKIDFTEGGWIHIPIWSRIFFSGNTRSRKRKLRFPFRCKASTKKMASSDRKLATDYKVFAILQRLQCSNSGKWGPKPEHPSVCAFILRILILLRGKHSVYLDSMCSVSLSLLLLCILQSKYKKSWWCFSTIETFSQNVNRTHWFLIDNPTPLLIRLIDRCLLTTPYRLAPTLMRKSANTAKRTNTFAKYIVCYTSGQGPSNISN